MFSSRASLKSLMHVCRSLATMLDSGVDVKKAFDIAKTKISDPRMSRTLSDIEDSIREGADITAAMQEHSPYLPQLLIDMTAVGEQTGSLPEVYFSLASHYENQIRMKRDFLSAIAWPVIQFVIAVFVIALLIFVLGWIAQSRGGTPIDVLGLGLSGASGAMIWLTSVFGTLFCLYIAYQVLNRSLAGKQIFDAYLLKIPMLGGCMRSFAVARFSWSFALTQQAGMPIKPSLETSFRSTSNGAFIAATGPVWADVSHGEFLGDALAATRLFPEDFIQMVQVAENSGTVPEALQRMSPQFDDQARRSLQTLAGMLGWGVWLTVAIFIIFFIFRIASFYIGMIDDATRDAMR